jgi:hypothetical protein
MFLKKIAALKLIPHPVYWYCRKIIQEDFPCWCQWTKITCELTFLQDKSQVYLDESPLNVHLTDQY